MFIMLPVTLTYTQTVRGRVPSIWASMSDLKLELLLSCYVNSGKLQNLSVVPSST